MRVTPVSLRTHRNFNQPKKISFGKIEEENRDKILKNIPTDPCVLHCSQEEIDEDRDIEISAVDANKGVMLKWGGEGHPRGLLYADIIKEHADKSCAKSYYEDMVTDNLRMNVIDHLEDRDAFECFYKYLFFINSKESIETLGKKSSEIKFTPEDYAMTYVDEEARLDEFVYGMFNRPL